MSLAVDEINQKESEPMNVTLYIREIANGVLVSTGSDYALKTADPSDPSELHFPTLEAALVDLPDIAKGAWEAEERREREFKESFRRRFGGSVAAAGGEGPHEDEEGVMVRDKPVMDTSAFQPGGSDGVDSGGEEAERST